MILNRLQFKHLGLSLSSISLGRRESKLDASNLDKVGMKNDFSKLLQVTNGIVNRTLIT